MAAIDECFEIASGTAANVETGKRRLAFDLPEQRLDILGDVMLARAVPEAFGKAVVVIDGASRDRFELRRIELAFSHVSESLNFLLHSTDDIIVVCGA